MGVFEDVHLEWDGKLFTIPAKRMMGAIAAIERHLTLKELHDNGTVRNTVPLSALAQAYGSVLRYAGAAIEDEAIYKLMFAGGDAPKSTVMAAIQALMMMMVPPNASSRAAARGSEPAGNVNRRQRRAAAARSSKKLSK